MQGIETLNKLAISRMDNSLTIERIFNTSTSLKEVFGCLLPLWLIKPIFAACKEFSLAVHHSRLSTRLSHFNPFLWLINGKLSGFGMYVNAIKRWTRNPFRLPSLNKSMVTYPRLLVDFGLNTRCFLTLSINPFSSIWYKPSKSFMSFMGTKIIKFLKTPTQ